MIIIYRMVKERYSNIWPNQTIVSDQSELTILLCQPMIIYVGYQQLQLGTAAFNYCHPIYMIRGEIRGDDDQMMVEAEVDAIVKMEMVIGDKV